MDFITGGIFGMVIGFMLAAVAARSHDRSCAKAGVYKIDDIAYKLTRIDP